MNDKRKQVFMQLEQIQNETNFIKYCNLLQKISIVNFTYDTISGKVIYVDNENQKYEINALKAASQTKMIDCEKIIATIKKHQRKELNFEQFLNLVVTYGVHSWICLLNEHKVIYNSKDGNILYQEQIPLG